MDAYEKWMKGYYIEHGFFSSETEMFAAWQAGREAGLREAADMLDIGRPPCDCITRNGIDGHYFHECSCSNSGDITSASAWCSLANQRDAILAAIGGDK